MTRTYLILTTLILSLFLTACGESNDATTQKVDKNQKEKIEIGMTKKVVADLLGPPQSTQTHTIEALTITHSEWSDELGTVSIQFINGKVKFNHFFAK